MSAIKGKNCGCKGIRTCLLCEKSDESSFKFPVNEQVKYAYTYCPHCNLCWPDDGETASKSNLPLYLGKVKLLLDFLSEEEEATAISEIDKIQWMPSQSGRNKQDFGPKVNFKKKKVKIGEFKGFPKFTENILHKFKNLSELSDFKPVELCHLEYAPERGSSIDPHVDDFWLWGERLVTINLNSSTVLTLVPFSEDTCECYEQFNHLAYDSSCRHMGNAKLTLCDHNFQNTCIQKYSVEPSPCFCKLDSGKDNIKVKCSNDFSNVKDDNSQSSALNNMKFRSNSGADDINNELYEPKFYSKISDSQRINDLRNLNINDSRHLNQTQIFSETNFTSQTPTDLNFTKSDEDARRKATMCSVFRTGISERTAAVKIFLPPRSLFVLAGCARYNWTHEIKRKDVLSRRLAITFRELTAEFLDGGKESKLGNELLSTASNFCDFN